MHHCRCREKKEINEKGESERRDWIRLERERPEGKEEQGAERLGLAKKKKD